VGTQPVDEYCREIETYLCQKNDGHLIRVVGPSFEVVSGWAAQGVPLKIAFAGIDRYFERYYRKGPRRRPVKIDFCDADVLDVFDEWRRATGVFAGSAEISNQQSAVSNRSVSLPAHLERVVLRLTSARASGSLGDAFDALIDRASTELDAARAKAGGLRGEARQALLDRLAALDAELVHQARMTLDEATRASLGRDAESELAGFRAGMTPEAFARAREAAIDRLVHHSVIIELNHRIASRHRQVDVDTVAQVIQPHVSMRRIVVLRLAGPHDPQKERPPLVLRASDRQRNRTAPARPLTRPLTRLPWPGGSGPTRSAGGCCARSRGSVTPTSPWPG
jgi:hypothetical protein